MKAPLFWQYNGLKALSLTPLSRLYYRQWRRKKNMTTPLDLSVPVISVGNVIVGGAGKTPISITVAEILAGIGAYPHFISRGYKGKLLGPVAVDVASHTAKDVGDEPLLLAKTAPCWVAKDKAAGAQLAIASGAKSLVLDDGLQSFSIAKDISIVVIDGIYGIGNGRMLPAGPMREPLDRALERSDAVVMMGTDCHDLVAQLPSGMPVFSASLTPDATVKDALTGRRVVGFAGIARPGKFEDTLRYMDVELAAFKDFPDHHYYSQGQLNALRQEARRYDAVLVTTAKDFVRIPDAWRKDIVALPVQAQFSDRQAFFAWLKGRLDQVR